MRTVVFLLLAGCAPAHQIAKFVAPANYVLPAGPRGEIATVTYASGWADEPPGPYEPQPFHEGWERPVEITVDGWIEVSPLTEAARATFYVRRMGLFRDDFRPAVALTGSIPGRLPNEVRVLPVDRPLATTERLAIADLTNPYLEHPLEDGDLVLLSVQGPEGRAEQYLFRARDFGLRTQFGAGVLFSLPFPRVPDSQSDLSSAFAASLAIGYRPRTRVPGIEFVTEQLSVVTSVAIGSTAFQTLTTGQGDAPAAFDALLVGGGLQLFGFVSGQVLVNLSSFTRDTRESELALAIGFDAVQFARFTERPLTRLFRKNKLRSTHSP